MAATTVMLAAVWSCGDNGGTEPPDNQNPTAEFTSQCTGLTCQFTNSSSDPDEGTTLSYAWNFGEPASPTNTSNEASPSHTYGASGTYTVSLTANDGEGGTHVRTHDVTVSGGPAPTASFTFTCDGPACTFTNTSTPADGFTSSWNFGDGETSAETNPVHTYEISETSTFTVALTVTATQGGATATASQSVTITPAATLECADGSNCTLLLPARASLTVTMTLSDCEFRNNRFSITAPIQETVFTNGCTVRDGTVFSINGGAPFEANTEIAAQFTQGNPGPNDPPRGTPALRFTGTYPEWILEYDDGGAPNAPGEPDYNDIVLTVRATPVP